MTALPFAAHTDESEATFLRRLLAANDATQALQVAVDHVVVTLGCAVSWVGVVQGDHLRMGAHCGIRSAEMASAWQLKVGEGIGGRVASERKAHMSRDYRHDSRRLPLLKRLIDNEGIQATLIVPLLMADEALGVLYAAQRRPYPWSSGEQAELEQIGQDLAIRLRQLDVDGRRAARSASAVREYERALRSQRAAASLAGALIGQDDLGASLDLVAHEVGGLVELRYRDGRLVRAAGEIGAGNARIVSRRELADTGGHVLTVVGVRELDPVDHATIDLAAGLLRMQLLRLGERERVIEQLTGDLLDQLLTGRIADPATFRQRLTTMGVASELAQVVVIGRRSGDIDPGDRLVESLAAAFAHSTTAVRGGRIVGVLDVSGGDPSERLLRLVEQGRQRDLVVGVGRTCRELTDYAMSYDQARAACEVGRRSAGRRQVLTAHDLGLVPLASVPLDQLRAMVRDVLGPLLESDQQRGTDFVETLRVYLGHDRHLPDTASDLHVHYNTVRNRIVRIEELLAVDVRDVEDRFRLETALRMHVLTHALSDTAVTT